MHAGQNATILPSSIDLVPEVDNFNPTPVQALREHCRSVPLPTHPITAIQKHKKNNITKRISAHNKNTQRVIPNISRVTQNTLRVIPNISRVTQNTLRVIPNITRTALP
jgi:hypothetical protein